MKKLITLVLAFVLTMTACAAYAAPDDLIGTYLTFGSYPQGEDGSVMPIEWLVLDIQDGQALVVSRFGLDAKPYNDEMIDVTWETCSLRSWLNDEFFKTAFSAEEQAMIALTDVDNSVSQGYDGWGSGSSNTKDHIFLLSYAQAHVYFNLEYYRVDGAKDNLAARVSPTPYAVERGAYTSPNVAHLTADGTDAGWWWLRSPGNLPFIGAYVRFDGSLRDDDRLLYRVGLVSGQVRPALWLNLESSGR